MEEEQYTEFVPFVGPPMLEPEPGQEYDPAQIEEMYCAGTPDPEGSYQAFGHYTEDGEWVEGDGECTEDVPEATPENCVEISPEEQAAVEQPDNFVEISAEEQAELDRLQSGESTVPGPVLDEQYDDATRLRLDAEKKAKEDAAGAPSKEPPDPKTTASGTHTTTSSTDTTKSDTSVKGGINPNGTTASGGIQMSHEEATESGKSKSQVGADGKITTTGGEGSISFGGGSTKFDPEKEKAREAKEAQERLDFERKKQTGEVDKDAKFEPSPEAKSTPAPGSSTKVTSGGGYDAEKGGYGSATAENEKTYADGSKTSISGGAKLGYGPDGHTGGGSLGVQHTDKDGKKIGANGSIEYDGKGTTAKIDAEYKGGSANLEVTEKDGESGVKGGVKGGSDTFSVGLSGGRVAKFGAPAKLPNGTYAVTYTVTTTGGVNVSASTDPKSPGAKYGGSLSSSGSSAISTTKVFASEAEALAFRTAENVGEPALPMYADQASGMKPGEKVVLTEGKGGAVDGSVGGQYGSIGGGMSGSNTERTSVEMLEGNAVFAERTAIIDDTGKLSYTAPGNLGGISGSNTDTKTVRTKIKVELGPDSAPNEAGRQAYARFMESGEVIAPAQVVSKTTSDGTKKGREINLGPVKGFEISEVIESTTYDEEGKLEQSSGERQRGWELKALGMGGSYGTKLEAIQRNDDDAKRAYVVTSSVKQTDAYDSMRRLNDVAGGGIRGEEELVGQKASGKWEVQSVMDPAAVDQFVAQVQKGNYNVNLVTTKEGEVKGSTKNYFEAGDNLKEALKEAGNDKDKQRAALAKFVAEGGEQAVDQMKALGGAGNEVFVTLKNDKDEVDPNFQGIQGRLDVESQIAALQARSESGDADPAALLADIKALQSKARARIINITPEKYPDLPPGVMQTEVGRSKSDLDRLEALTGPLREKVKNDRLAKLDPAERAARAKQTEIGAELEDVADPSTQGGSIGLMGAAKTDPLMRQGIMFKRLATAKAGAEKERGAARAAQKSHTGAGWKTTSRRPRDRIADSSDMYAKDYADADSTVILGHGAFEQGATQESVAHAMPESDDASINASIACIETAIAAFGKAKGYFSDAIQTYGAIATANPDEGIQ